MDLLRNDLWEWDAILYSLAQRTRLPPARSRPSRLVKPHKAKDISTLTIEFDRPVVIVCSLSSPSRRTI
jgi:hypothetical protein